MRQLLHWVLPSLNPKDRYHDYFLCSVALELLKAEGINILTENFHTSKSILSLLLSYR